MMSAGKNNQTRGEIANISVKKISYQAFVSEGRGPITIMIYILLLMEGFFVYIYIYTVICIYFSLASYPTRIEGVGLI